MRSYVDAVNNPTPSSMRMRFGPSGVHFFNRANGLNILIDEIPPRRDKWHRAPRNVSIALTNACDLHCGYCFAPKRQASLRLATVLAWLDELNANGCLGVGFGGGEPTLYKQLPELCQYATDRTGMAVTLTTHGHHLDDKLLNALRGKIHFVRLSMDGIGATYESLRGRAFTAFLGRADAVSKVFPFGINYVVNSRTLPELDAATKLAAAVGASQFLLLPERRTPTTAGISPETRGVLLEWVAQYDGEIPLAVSEMEAEGMPISNPLNAETGLQSYAHVDASGVLKQCSYDNNGVTIGPTGIIQAIKELEAIRTETV